MQQLAVSQQNWRISVRKKKKKNNRKTSEQKWYTHTEQYNYALCPRFFFLLVLFFFFNFMKASGECPNQTDHLQDMRGFPLGSVKYEVSMLFRLQECD